MEPVQLANPENAFEGGVLDKKWMFNAVAHMNLWHAGEVKLPSTDWGSGRILVSNTGWVVDLTKLKVPAAAQLQLLREFDISVQSDNDSTVRVMRGTWMGIGQAGGTNAGTRAAYNILTVANGDTIYVRFDTNTYAVTVLAGATKPSNNEHIGLYYRGLATVTIASGRISINQYLWGPLEYTMRFNDRRQFDIEPFIDGTANVSVKCGTWMGIRKTAGTTDALTRSEYIGVGVANGYTVYVGVNTYSGTLVYGCAATVPADQPEYQQWYVGLATIAVTAGVVSVDQYRWGPLEYTKRYNTSYALLWDPTSSTAHTDSWYNYSPLDSSGAVRAGYNSVTWKGDRYYQTSSSITIDGVTFYVVTTKVFSRTVTIDSNGGTSNISAEFLKTTLTWVSDTSV